MDMHYMQKNIPSGSFGQFAFYYIMFIDCRNRYKAIMNCISNFRCENMTRNYALKTLFK